MNVPPPTPSPAPGEAPTEAPEEAADPHLWVSVLAGGIGSRFWPVSTPARPKQLLPLASDRPLVVDTVERARGLAPDRRIRILTGTRLVAPFRSVLPDLAESAYLVEPRARGTAPALAWAAWALRREDPDAVLVSLHSDHVLRPEAAFRRVVRAAASLARSEDLLVTLGKPAERPETGYGYIQPGAPLQVPGGGADGSAARVAAFHEKPDGATAARYAASGYLWNTGIFVWTARRFLAELEAHAPEIAEHLSALDAGDVAGFFDRCPSVAVDVAVLERSRRVGVVRADFEWDDVGSWEALARTRPLDQGDNAVVGEARIVAGERNIVFSDGAGPVVLFGVDDLVAVRTEGVVLVTRRERAPDLKRLLDALPPGLRTLEAGSGGRNAAGGSGPDAGGAPAPGAVPTTGELPEGGPVAPPSPGGPAPGTDDGGDTPDPSHGSRPPR